MKKTVLVIIAIATLTLGMMTAVYAIDNNNSGNFFGYRGQMMNQGNNSTYNSMIEIMRSNGFESAAKAMENRDLNAMNDFMNNLTDDQYNQMIKIMRDNGYGSMFRMMGSFNKQGMINMHNFMMRR